MRPLCALLLLAACSSPQQALERYCARTGACACDGGGCCIQPGRTCEEGQPCCSGACAAGRCPGSAEDGGGEPGVCAAACLNTDAGCPNGSCCQADRQCASGQCLIALCADAVGGRGDAGAGCDDLNDCSVGARCDLGTWPRVCRSFADAGPPECWADGVACSGDPECCSGSCSGGTCRGPCSVVDGNPCTAASQCCDFDERACGGSNACAFEVAGEFSLGTWCDFDDQCLSKRCVLSHCAAASTSNPGPLGSCGGGETCSGGGFCDAGTCCQPPGGACVADRSCCSGQCLAQRCAPKSACAGPTEPCRDDTDCCAPFGCNFTRRCSPTLLTTLSPSPCVLEDNATCRFPSSQTFCRVPGQTTAELACCLERTPDGGLTSCVDAGTCTCTGLSCNPSDAGHLCPL